MNLIRIVLRQMRQRALSTTLTLLSVALGVALAVSVGVIEKQGRAVFAHAFGYELIVGPKGSDLSLVLNSVYHLGKAQGTIPYTLYEQLAGETPRGEPNPFRGQAAWAVPYAVGDSYKGQRIVATLPKLFGVAADGTALPAAKTPEFAMGRRYAFSAGRVFHPARFEAVVGAEAARRANLTLGSKLKASHGQDSAGDEHDETWTVVGILAPTQTANDRVIFIPLATFYAIPTHEAGVHAIDRIRHGPAGTPPAKTAPATAPHQDRADHDADDHDYKPHADPGGEAHDDHAGHDHAAYRQNPDGTITPNLPRNLWQVSAILVRTSGPVALPRLQSHFRAAPDAMAVGPAEVMARFFDDILAPVSSMLTLIFLLVIAVAAVSILVSIYNSVSARTREIAILRALGATRGRIVAIIAAEAGLIGLLGALAGVALAHALAAAASAYLAGTVGQGIAWWQVSASEAAFVAAATGLSLLAGLVPALKAYRAPVAENLVS